MERELKLHEAQNHVAEMFVNTMNMVNMNIVNMVNVQAMRRYFHSSNRTESGKSECG